MRAFGCVGVLAAVVIGLGSSSTFGPARAAPPPASVDVLRLVWWSDVGFPTPFAVSTTGPGGVVRLSLLYDTLTWKDAAGIVPWLATSWRVSTDGRTYT
jgi:peptide/nickel transport system substrate-binding protein